MAIPALPTPTLTPAPAPAPAPPNQVSNGQPKADEQQKKINFLEKIIEINIGLNLAVGGILLFVLILVFAWRLNLINVFGPKEANKPASAPAVVVKPAAVAQDLDDKTAPAIFISKQGLDIKKAFQAKPNDLRLTISGQLKKEVLGFLPYWALAESGDININLLTSVSYFGLEVDGNGNIIKTDAGGNIIEPWFHFQSDPKFSEFIKRVKRNRTKIYLTLKCFNQANIVRLVTDEEAINNFVNNAVYLVNSRSLDGINLDFEYIGTPDQAVTDGFSLLVIKLNKELKRENPKTKLTIDTFIDAASNTRIHDVPILAANSDGLVIMGYDFHTPDSSAPGPIAPMEGAGISVTGLMSSYLEKAPADKLILAIAYYGYDWPTTGGRADVKALTYAEIADNNKNSQINWDENAQSPWYSYKDPQEGGQVRTVYFENPRSLGVKYDFVNQKKLQGMGIWALGMDGKRTDLLHLLSDKFSY
ncbi:hypothetical protein HYW46_02915 [Candidatus Daviesbacteria bacterium]|nr:hypothetical protein [Candidatus Daviesbacteria bacterium]